HKVAYATATSSGTAAVHAALGALRLDIAQEVLSSPITDPGGVAPILWNNCIPIFADAVPATMNVDPASIAERITDRTRAIIVTHLAGQPVDMDPVMALAKEHSLPVIEDCSQAHGAVYKGRLVGTIGDVGVFSLMGGKHHTAGGQGGMVITDNEELYWNAKRFADRGKPFNSSEKKNLFLGLNYRMTEIEAVIGRCQLRKLDTVLARRRKVVAALGEAISELQAIRLGTVIPDAVSSYWLVLLHVDAACLTVSKERFALAAAAEGAPMDPHYDWIVYESPWFRTRATYGCSGCPWTCPFYGRDVAYEGSCPGARAGIDSHMVLHIHEGYGDQEVEDIAAALAKVEQAYLR
ncbi:MAG: DegT/DnrJ/EryC1/StrS family aminotransferase, partial [Chloroflexi bacterium]|nr:DegT/DnrJ/EryC1/StrS family aminotransferase [Chloroflexota bacterium]